MDELTRKAYQLRRDIIEEVYRSGAGHVGGDLSVIDILTVLYYRVMHVSPDNWKQPDRDRFLLSKGHCVDALYMVLGDLGFFDKQEAINTFSAYGSRYIGHPNTEVPGIEINSGSLGHGLALGVVGGVDFAGLIGDRPQPLQPEDLSLKPVQQGLVAAVDPQGHDGVHGKKGGLDRLGLGGTAR